GVGGGHARVDARAVVDAAAVARDLTLGLERRVVEARPARGEDHRHGRGDDHRRALAHRHLPPAGPDLRWFATPGLISYPKGDIRVRSPAGTRYRSRQ